MRIRIQGDERSYRVWAVDKDGSTRELEGVANVSLYICPNGQAEATVYFKNPELDLEVPRAADGVRAG